MTTIKSKSWAPVFEKIVGYVPILRGYRGKEGLRDQDKILRSHTADRLASLKGTVENAKRGLVDRGKLAGLDRLDRLARVLDRARDTHRFEAYGYSGYFDPVKILEEQLAALYRADLAILEEVEALGPVLAGLADPALSDAERDRRAADAEKRARALVESIEGRKQAFLKLGTGA